MTGATPDAVPISPIFRRYAGFLTRRAGPVVCTTCFLYLIFLASLGATPFVLDTAGESFLLREQPIATHWDSVRQGQERTVYDLETAITKDTVLPQQSVPIFGVQIFFEATGDTVFTTKGLLEMQKLEQSVFNFKSGDLSYDQFCLRIYNGTQHACAPPLSVLPLFFDDPTDASTIKDESEFQGILTTLASADPEMTALRSQLVGKQFTASSLDAPVSLSVFTFGLPLAGYKNHEFDLDKQTSEYHAFTAAMYQELLKDAYSDGDEDEDAVLVRFVGSGVTEAELNDLLITDVLLVFGSLIFIYCYMWYHTKSALLTTVGLTEVVMSIPASYFIYRYLFGIVGFNQLNFLGLFVILGIGADDNFIMLDAWKQSVLQHPEIAGRVESRLAFTLQRAGSTMLASSLTTTGALLANMFAPLPGMAAFGLFGALLVLTDFLFVVTWYPSWVILHQRWSRYGFLSLFQNLQTVKTRRKAKATSGDGDGNGTGNSSTDVLDNPTDYRPLEKMFRDRFAPVLFKYRHVALGVFGIIFVLACVGFAHLEPGNEGNLQVVRENVDANINDALDLSINGFPSPAVTFRIHATWGLDGMDRAGVSLVDGTERGTVKFLDSFDLSSTAAQLFIEETCLQFAALEPVLDLTPDNVYCWVDDFKTFLNQTGGTFPVAQSLFHDTVRNFTAWNALQRLGGAAPPFSDPLDALPTFDASLRYDNPSFADESGPVLRYMDLLGDTALSFDDPDKEARRQYDIMNSWVQKRNEEAEAAGLPGLANGQVGSLVFVMIELGESLINGAYLTMLFSIVFVFVVMLAATRGQVAISAMATISVLGVVVTVAGLIPAFGWKLGFVESTALIVIVGLSVDYSIHIAIAYIDSMRDIRQDTLDHAHLPAVQGMDLSPNEALRFARVRRTMLDIGVSIFSSAITTSGSAMFLVIAKVSFFERFGLLILLTTVASIGWAFTFLLAMLAQFGPLGNLDRPGVATEMKSMDQAQDVDDNAA